jgi:hypothetical protein
MWLSRKTFLVDGAAKLVLFLGTWAHADPPLRLLPSSPLYADGQRVHLLKIIATEQFHRGNHKVSGLRAERGTLFGTAEVASDGTTIVQYRPPKVAGFTRDHLRLVYDAKETAIELALMPPPSPVHLAIEVAPLVSTKNTTTEVRIHVRDDAGRPARAALRLGASLGQIGPPMAVGLGEYVAIFARPQERYPEVAILAARSITDGAFAATSLSLPAKVTVNGEGEPGAQMTLFVDGRSFGPQTIDSAGRFSFPIQLPPGGRVTGVSIDRAGNRKKREINLGIPPFPRLFLSAFPSDLRAGAAAQVVTFSVDGRGNPERTTAPVLLADAGTLSPSHPAGTGATIWSYTAPLQIGSGVVHLSASGVRASIRLRPGPPRQIEIRKPLEPLLTGSESTAEIEVAVHDAQGAPVDGARLMASLQGGRVREVVPKDGGKYLIRVEPPADPRPGTARLHVEVMGISPGAPRHLSLHRASGTHFGIEAWVDDDLGTPIPDCEVALFSDENTRRQKTDHFGVARFEAPDPTGSFQYRAEVVGLPGVAAVFEGWKSDRHLVAVASHAGEGVDEITSASNDPPFDAALDVDLPLVPAAPIELRMEITDASRAGASTRIKVLLSGAVSVVKDAELLFASSGGQLSTVRTGVWGAELRFTPPKGATPGARFTISATDAHSGVTTFTDVVVR